MNKIILLFLIFLLTSSCSCKHYDNINLRNTLYFSIMNNEFDRLSLAGTENIDSVDRFINTESSINNMDIALNEGYKAIIDDICNFKYKYIKEKKICKKYKFSDWETSNIGFRNWPLHVKGELLLDKIKILNLKIITMELLDKKDLVPVIEQDKIYLKKYINELSELSKEDNWAD